MDPFSFLAIGWTAKAFQRLAARATGAINSRFCEALARVFVFLLKRMMYPRGLLSLDRRLLSPLQELLSLRFCRPCHCCCSSSGQFCRLSQLCWSLPSGAPRHEWFQPPMPLFLLASPRPWTLRILRSPVFETTNGDKTNNQLKKRNERLSRCVIVFHLLSSQLVRALAV